MSEELEPGGEGLTLVDHLTEFRGRLIKSVFAVLITTFVCFHFSQQIFEVIRKPIAPYLPSGGLIYTGPIDKFMAYVKLSLVGGVILACPFWLFQVWQFVAPGLYKKEKSYASGFIVSGTFLFLTGAAFSYYVVLPMAFHFLMTFGGEADKPMIAIDSYLSFVTQITVMFGLSFELPLVLVTLSLMGLISKQFLTTNRRYAVMIMTIVSAIVTPPDLLSMLLMLGPLWFLFELGVFIVGLIERKRASEPAA